MKRHNYRITMFKSLLVSIVVLLSSTLINAYQDEEPVKPRLSMGFFKDPDRGSYLKVKARARAEKGYDDLVGLSVNFYKIGEEDQLLGNEVTDESGTGVFVLAPDALIAPDSTGILSFEARVEDVEGYSDASTDLEAATCTIELKFSEKDSLGYISAHLVNSIGEPVAEEDVTFYVKRSFRNLTIGKDFYSTDENGEASVELINDLPARSDGTLIVGLLLDDHYLYGTIRQETVVTYGTPVEIDQAFFERSMWGTRDKTPWWLLIFPNIILLSVWGILMFLVYNLYCIYKSKS